MSNLTYIVFTYLGLYIVCVCLHYQPTENMKNVIFIQPNRKN